MKPILLSYHIKAYIREIYRMNIKMNLIKKYIKEYKYEISKPIQPTHVEEKHTQNTYIEGLNILQHSYRYPYKFSVRSTPHYPDGRR